MDPPGSEPPAIFYQDEGSAFDATLDDVWAFVGSGQAHSTAHRHRAVRRERRSELEGAYSWEQVFEGRAQRFTMRWATFWPLGIAYEVVEGPFDGSRFWLYYEPTGARTKVGVVGMFRSPSIPLPRLRAALDRFFTIEFEQDVAGLNAWRRDERAAASR